ncbi:MAG: RNA-guided endonuclease InsQ/TnpB family protein [Planctomycetota bacterium]|jgi:putative transposase
MLLSYKFRLYPNNEQRQAMDRILEIHRQLYNAALQERRMAWQKCGVSIYYNDQASQLKELRKFDKDAAWLNYSSIQQTLRRLDKAFQAFFRRAKAGEKPGYPRFKGKRWYKSVCYVYGDGIRLKDGRLYIQNVSLVRLFQHRDIPDDARIKMAILKRDNLGNWYVIFQLELPDPEPGNIIDPDIGIDMGLLSFATLSTGEQIDNPRWFRESEQKLAILQHRRSRCKRGSCQYRELTRQIRRLHEHIANQRHDFHHKVSTELVRCFGFIAVEDLNVNGLCRSHVAKSMGDAGWGYFLAMLSYKAANAGKTVVKVNPNYTSQACSGCGCIVQKSLSDRLHICPHCGIVLDRDHNAALNVLARGQRVAVKRSEALASVGGSSPL